MKILKYFGSLFFCVIALGIGAASPLSAENSTLVDAINLFKDETAKLGSPKVEGVNLFFGTTKMNGNYEIVDKVKTQFNCTATLFVKKGDSFIRISTNVIKDGNRAVGTPLDPNGKAIAAVKTGEKFSGQVDILGSPYDTIYEPIKDGDSNIVGVYYVGIPLSK